MSVHHQQTQASSFCPVDLASAARALEHLRDTQPLVQCITNGVTTQFMANTLLALGATPAMVDIPREAGAFAAVASGLLINTGTPHAEPRAAMIEAVHSANDAGTPWVLDPVAVGTLPVRTPLAKELASLNPTIIRGNASEILALSGGGQGGRGVDSTDTPETALQTAQELAERTGAVVAISGAVDLLTDGRRTAANPYGSHMLTRITGGGCALGAVLAAFCHENEDPLDAAVSAHAIYGIAAEHAALVTQGPGSFAMAFLDALAALDPDMIDSPMLETQTQA